MEAESGAVPLKGKLAFSGQERMKLLGEFDNWVFNRFEPRFISIWLFYITFFCFFAILRPPFQSPDEFSHFGRMCGIFNGVWCAKNNFTNIGNTGLIELYSAKRLGDLPRNRVERLSNDEVQHLKSLPRVKVVPSIPIDISSCDREWVRINVTRRAEQSEYCRCLITETGKLQECGYFITTAWQYPPLYYLFGANMLSLVNYVALPPYNAFYLIRIGTAIFSAGLWSLAITILAKTFPISRAMCLAICGIPMLSFMCSAINPDAFLYPLVTLCAACFNWGLSEDKPDVWMWYSCTLCVALLCKMTAFFVVPPLTLIAILTLRKGGSAFVTFTLTTVVGFGGAVFFYYGLFGRFDLPSESGPYISLINYLTIPYTYGAMYKSFWGSLGWLDVDVGLWASHILWILVIIANMISFKTILKSRGVPGKNSLSNIMSMNSILVCWFIFVGHASTLVASEYIHFRQLEWINQGRYLLPAVTFLLIGALCKKNIIARLFLITLIAFEIWMVNTMIYRYFDEGWCGWLKSLPFV